MAFLLGPKRHGEYELRASKTYRILTIIVILWLYTFLTYLKYYILMMLGNSTMKSDLCLKSEEMSIELKLLWYKIARLNSVRAKRTYLSIRQYVCGAKICLVFKNKVSYTMLSWEWIYYHHMNTSKQNMCILFHLMRFRCILHNVLYSFFTTNKINIFKMKWDMLVIYPRWG